MDVRYLGYFLAEELKLKGRVCSVIADVQSGRDWADTPFSINTELGYLTTPITPRELATGARPEVLRIGNCMAITPDGKAIINSFDEIELVDLSSGTTCTEGRLVNPIVCDTRRTRRATIKESAPFPIDTMHAFIYKGDIYLACVVDEQRPSPDFDPWNIYFIRITPEGRVLSGPNYIDHMVSRWDSTFRVSMPSRIPDSPFRQSYVMYTDLFLHFVYFLDEMPFTDSVDINERDFAHQATKATKIIRVEEDLPRVCAECGRDLSGLEYPTAYEIEPGKFGLICSDCREEIHEPFMEENFKFCLRPLIPWGMSPEGARKVLETLAESG